MIDKIVQGLQNDYPSISWVRYGDGNLPSQPYGVVKSEKQVNGRGVRIIIHRNPGYVNELEDDLRLVVSILTEKGYTSRNGNYNQLGRLIDYTDVTPLSEDGTISMEALFLMPTTSF